MEKTGMWVCGVSILLVSIGLNIFVVTYHFASAGKILKEKPQQGLSLSWTEKAAAEAEAVAAIDCSGHGNVYVDGVIEGGDPKPVCECSLCYGGPDCSILDRNCSANANSGDPLFMEPYWKQNAETSAVVLSGWHRMSYYFPDESYISKQLENYLIKLHSVTKNAVTQGKYIVFGTGSTQLLTAAVFALSINRTTPATVLAEPPYYPAYRSQIDYFETARFEFNDSILRQNSDEQFIEYVTSPNNPDGKLKKAALNGPNVKPIHDHAYYWPHYTAIPEPADEDLMVFTLSKFTGHAGSRFGWALVKDETVYKNMLDYIDLAEIGTSRETQLRTLQLLRSILSDDGAQLYKFAYTNMRKRWLKMKEIFSSSNRFKIQELPDQYCIYFNRVRGPSPAYVWVECVKEEDTDCMAIFEEAKITGRPGSLFASDDRHVRLTLMRSNDDFDLLVGRLNDLVAKEKVGARIKMRSSI